MDNNNFEIDINNNNEPYKFVKEFFIDREFEEVEGGEYNEEGFYVTLEGSFWDPDGDYHNRYGFDRYGGTYDLNKCYIPGDGWIEEYQCYKEDLHLHENDQEIINEILNDRLEESCSNAQRVLNMLDFEEEQITTPNTNFNSQMKNKLQINSTHNSNIKSIPFEGFQSAKKLLMSNNKAAAEKGMDIDIDVDFKDTHLNQENIIN